MSLNSNPARILGIPYVPYLTYASLGSMLDLSNGSAGVQPLNEEIRREEQDSGARRKGVGPAEPSRGAYEPPQLRRVGSLRDLLGKSGVVCDNPVKPGCGVPERKPF